MTEEGTSDIPLKIYKTTPGNHARRDKFDNEKGWYNLRQIDVIRDEILDWNREKYAFIFRHRLRVHSKYVSKIV